MAKKNIFDELDLDSLGDISNPIEAVESELDRRKRVAKKNEEPLSKNLKKISVANIRLSEYHDRISNLLNKRNCSDLIDSFGEQGQLRPITVIAIENSGKDEYFYEIVTGARRYWTATFLRYERIDCEIIPKNVSTLERVVRNRADNTQVKQSDYEEAFFVKKLKKELFGGSQRKTAEKLKIPRTTLRRYLALAELPVTLFSFIDDLTSFKTTHSEKINKVTANFDLKKIVKELEKEVKDEKVSPNQLVKIISDYVNNFNKNNTSELKKKEYLSGAFKQDKDYFYIDIKASKGKYKNPEDLIRSLIPKIEELFK